MRRPPNILHLLLTALTTAEALRITYMKSSVETLRNENIILPCNISGLNTANALSILWTRKSENGTVDDVCEYGDNGVTVFRPGCKMEVAEILKGNAELHIPRVQFTDEGEYTCKVINTPDSASGTTTLQVSAPPSADVTPPDPTIELGTERTMTCDVYNFYPKDVSIRWVQYLKGSSECQLLEIWMCVKKLIVNSDGTFNVTSLLTLKPKKEDDGSIYSCVITHRSLSTDLSRNFTLTVTEKEDNTKAVITAVITTLLMVGLLGFLGFLYVRFIRKDPPTLSEITGNDELTDMNKTTLTCQIMNFRPNNIEISVCMRRSEEERMRIIYTWRSGGPGTAVMSSDDDVELGRPLMNGSAGHKNRPLELEVDPRITMRKLGRFSCQCSLHITPGYELDNEAELSIQVTHPALTSPASVRRTLKVIGVPPKLSSIMAPKCVTHEEKLTLICPINAFKPRALTITWLKKDRDHRETEVVTWTPENSTHNEKYSHNLKEDEYDDKSYSFLSALSMKSTITEDDGVTYICRVFHPATGHREEKEQTIRVTAVPVLDSILRDQDRVYVGEKLDLSCRIHGFYPRDIQVTWYTEDNVVIPSHTTEPLQENDGLCHVTSTSTYTPTMTDLGKTFRCEVQHDSLWKPKCVFLTLSHIVSPPDLGDILCDPQFPEPEAPVTLSCEINNMYPETFDNLQWYCGITKLRPDKWKTNIQQNTESKIFSGTTELTLASTLDSHGKQIRLDVVHCGKVFTKEFLLQLKGFPVLSDITTDPLKADYGKPLTLRCDVTGCNHDDITWVTWSVRGKESRTQTGDVLSCYLTIIPTAEDYGKAYTCTVAHRGTGKPVVKKKHLRLPETAPTLSDIVVRPATLTANQEASFQVTISGYSPRDMLIKWCKAFSTFPQSHVTMSEPEIGSDYLYKCSSTLTFTPLMSDDGAEVRCEVTHSKNVRQKRSTLHLADGSDKTKAALKPGPKKTFRIREIRCVTERPRAGQKVTLVAYIDACEAHSAEFTWYNGMFTIDEEIENKQDGADCTSSVTFTPGPHTHCTIKLEAFYNYQTAEESYSLPLE